MDHLPTDPDERFYVPDERPDIEGRARKALNTNSDERARHYLRNAKEAMPDNSLICCREPLMNESIVAGYAALGPQDEQECMLSTQLIMLQEHFMDCLHRAKKHGLDPRIRDQELRHAERLCALALRTSEAFDKHRGLGRQQKITVEHVNVNAGGQAIVGEVHTGENANQGSRPKNAAAEPAALTDESSADAIGRCALDGLTKEAAAPRQRRRN